MDLPLSLRLVALAYHRSSNQHALCPLGRIASFITGVNHTHPGGHPGDPPTPVVRVETPAGLHKMQFTWLTPDHTVRTVQKAYCGARLASHLKARGIPPPKGFVRLFASLVDGFGGVRAPEVKHLFTVLGTPVDSAQIEEAMRDAPTDFSDYFAVQLTCLGSPGQLLYETQTLGSLGLAPNTTLELVVMIRADRADYDAACRLSTNHRAHYMSKMILNHRIQVLHWGRNSVVYNVCSRHDELFADPAVAIRLVQQRGTVLRHLPLDLRDDAHIVRAAIQTDPETLKYVSRRLRGTYQIVLAAIHQNPRALRWASKDLRGNADLVAVAIKQDASCIKYATTRLRRDRRLAMLVLENGGSIWCISKRLHNDRDVMLAAIRADHTIFPHIPDVLRYDRQIAIAAVRYHGLNLASLPPEMRADREVVRAAVLSHGNVLHLASDDLRTDRALMQLAAAQQRDCD